MRRLAFARPGFPTLLGLAVLAAVWIAPVTADASECDSNLMIVLDRSCSMTKKPAGETQSKWDLSVAAIQKLTEDYEGQLRLGLIMFPDEDGERCVQDGPIYVSVGEGTEGLVMDAINGTAPDGPCVTNIDTAMAQVADDPAFHPGPEPAERRSFVLLITDGKQSSACGGVDKDPDTEQTILELFDLGYPTYVVGFGDGVRPASLEGFALAGGVPKVGDPVYYQADTAVELEEALTHIVGDVVAGDPEFGGCKGAPCPDERCFGPYESCVEGACLPFLPDAGPVDPFPSGPDAGIDDPGGSGATGADLGGCGCRAKRSSQRSEWMAVALLLVALLLVRRNRES